MDADFRDFFIERWRHYFAKADLPIGYFYTDQLSDGSGVANVDRCIICNIARVLDGVTYVYDVGTPGCAGGKRYTGFTQRLRPNFECFLSCGIPGEMEGERYKQSPELVKEYLAHHPPFEAPSKHLVFKRWDQFEGADEPLAVVFFARPDVLSGLFTLANYDTHDAMGVKAPFGSGCASIVNYPYVESRSDNPRCILGMFDVSARPCVPPATLTFAVPMRRFREMVRNMDESFLTTASWHQVRDRITGE